MSSLRFAVALIVLMALEVPSDSGRILERFGADIVAGWLGQLVLLSMLIDGLKGTLPRATMLIPILFYLSYYLVFWVQGIHIRLESDELRKTNPKTILEFNSKLHSLVFEQAGVFAATHSIPAVYTKDSSYIQDGYVSYRLIARDEIKEYLSRNANDVQLLSVDWDNSIESNVRILRIPEHPLGKVITASVHDSNGEGLKDWNIGFETTSLSADGHVVGIFKSGYVHRLPIVPFFTIGCKFSSEPPKRRCQPEFATERVPIESRPDSVDRTLYPDPVSIMLGIKALSHYEIAHFRHSDLGADLSIRAAPGEDAAFGALRDIISGQSPPVSWKTGSLIAINPSRLAPFAAAMTKRFLDLSSNRRLRRSWSNSNRSGCWPPGSRPSAPANLRQYRTFCPTRQERITQYGITIPYCISGSRTQAPRCIRCIVTSIWRRTRPSGKGCWLLPPFAELVRRTAN